MTSSRPARLTRPFGSELQALRDRLASSGVAVEEDASLRGIRRFYAADPFGNRLEFVDDADGGFTERG